MVFVRTCRTILEVVFGVTVVAMALIALLGALALSVSTIGLAIERLG